MNATRTLVWSATSALLIYSVSLPASAYLDPVTGAFILQGIGAVVLGTIAAVKRFRDRVLDFVFRRKKGATESNGQ